MSDLEKTEKEVNPQPPEPQVDPAKKEVAPQPPEPQVDPAKEDEEKRKEQEETANNKAKVNVEQEEEKKKARVDASNTVDVDANPELKNKEADVDAANKGKTPKVAPKKSKPIGSPIGFSNIECIEKPEEYFKGVFRNALVALDRTTHAIVKFAIKHKRVNIPDNKEDNKNKENKETATNSGPEELEKLKGNFADAVKQFEGNYAKYTDDYNKTAQEYSADPNRDKNDWPPQSIKEKHAQILKESDMVLEQGKKLGQVFDKHIAQLSKDATSPEQKQELGLMNKDVQQFQAELQKVSGINEKIRNQSSTPNKPILEDFNNEFKELSKCSGGSKDQLKPTPTQTPAYDKDQKEKEEKEKNAALEAQKQAQEESKKEKKEDEEEPTHGPTPSSH